MITAQWEHGQTITRNVSFFKQVPPNFSASALHASEESDDELWLGPPDNVEPPGLPGPPPVAPYNADTTGSCYLARHRQQPACLNDYVVG